MKELFAFLWSSAPELMSLLCIVGVLAFIVVKLTLFFTDFKNMGLKINSLEIRVSRLEEQIHLLNTKVDRIIDYLLNEKSKEK